MSSERRVPIVYQLVTPGNVGTLFDLKGNQFVALSPTSATIWHAVFERQERMPWPSVSAALRLSSPETVGLVNEQLRLWQADRLIGHPSERPPDAVTRSPRSALRELPPPDLFTWVTPSAIGSLGLATVRAMRALRRSGLEAALRHLGLAKSHGQKSTASSQLPELLCAYWAIRRAFRQGRLDCLERSLILSWMLVGAGLKPVLCFGIVQMPFRAHAWVEIDDVVVNDSVDSVRNYSVIASF